jgi:hypothetical protein
MERLRNQIRNLLKSFQLKNSDSEVLAFEKVIQNLISENDPPTPFSFSALFEIGNQHGETSGLSGILPLTVEAGGAENWGTDPEIAKHWTDLLPRHSERFILGRYSDFC